MKKKDKIYDSPEYKQIREHLPEILKEMERDKGLKQYQMPEGWNEDFERIYQAEHRKERIRNRILAGACAAIILGIGAVHVGERLELTSMVQADDIGKIHEDEFEDDIGKIHEDEFEDGEYQYNTYGNVNEDELFSEDENEIIFESSSPEQVYNEMRTQIKMPFLWVAELPDNYMIGDAVYNKLHRNMSYKIYNEDNFIYVSQRMQIEDGSNGLVNEGIVEEKVWIDDLQENVDIYRSPQDDSLNCSILYKNNIAFIVSNMELEELKEIISKIYYK